MKKYLVAVEMLMLAVFLCSCVATNKELAPKAADMALTAEGNVGGLVLQNNRLRMTFSAENGGVEKIENLATKTCYTVEDNVADFPFVLLLKKPGWAPPGPSLSAKKEGLNFSHKLIKTKKGRELELRYDYVAEKMLVKLNIVLDDDSDFTSWTMTIDNRSKHDVFEMYFPMIAGVRIGPRAEDDMIVVPAGMRGGYRFPNPSTRNFLNQYIGAGNMQWVDIYDDPQKEGKGGLYMGKHDKELIGCRIGFYGQKGKSVKLVMAVSCGVPAGQKWVSDPFVFGVHTGDWHRGADIYSAWAHSWMKMPRHPEWLQMLDGWDDFGKDIGKSYARLHHALPRFKYPGSPEAERNFTERIKKEREGGRRISNYVNGQCARVDEVIKGLRNMYPKMPKDVWAPKWHGELRNGAVRTPNGGFIGQYCRGPKEKWTIETEKGIPCGDYIMCPASEEWRKFLKYWIVEKFVKEYGVDAIYLDQSAAAGAKKCYNPDHGHQHPGVWPHGSTKMVEEIVTAARKINPDFVMALEGSADCMGQFVNIHVVSKSAVLKDPNIYPEPFFYTFPEFIIYDGYNNGRADEEPQNVFDKIFMRGHRFDLISRGCYTKDGVDLRRAVKAWQYRAKFRDTVGVQTSDKEIEARLFVRNDSKGKGAVVNVRNAGGLKEATVTVSTKEFGKVKKVYSAALGRALAPFKGYKQTAGTVVLPVPEERLSSYILIVKGKPGA